MKKRRGKKEDEKEKRKKKMKKRRGKREMKKRRGKREEERSTRSTLRRVPLAVSRGRFGASCLSRLVGCRFWSVSKSLCV